jgi:hypothetical protein|tara:strand:- start:570 stop:950 length:381 start_codon:yes stop_codon:yes gene_type:complete
MAHFAKIGLNNKVIEVHVVANDVLKDSNGIEHEINGIKFLTEITYWPIWKQTSYNSTIRKNYAGPGYTYDEDRDAFIPLKPYNSWILNEETCRWDPPVVRPELTNEEIEDKKYYNWNEETKQWDLL